jgi:hypothetical protein
MENGNIEIPAPPDAGNPPTPGAGHRHPPSWNGAAPQAPLPRFEFIAALLIGGLLLLVAVPAISNSWMPVAFSSVLLAGGIALVLYAFGSHVEIALPWVVAVGCAAVMFATYLLINQQHRKEIVEIFVESEGQKFSQPKAKIGAQQLFGVLDDPSLDQVTGSNNQIIGRDVSGNFTIILRAGKDITSGRAYMNLSLFFLGENEPTDFRRIPGDHLFNAMGSGDPVFWTIRNKTQLYHV